MRQDLSAFAESRRDALVALLSDLVAARTENPPGNEHLAAKVVAEFFHNCGISCKTYEAEPGRTNIIGIVGHGRPRVLIACHLDTVPAGEGWETDPFLATVKEDLICGRGTCDNKGAMASMLMAGAFLKSIEEELRGEVWLAGVADEERGSRLGLGYLVREKVLDVDAALVPDIPEHMQLIDVAEKGVCWVELISYGKQAHGSRPEEGVNAIWNMTHLLSKLKETRLPYTAHRHLSPPTLNLGQIEGGSAPNMVAAICKASIDIRYLPGTSPEEIVNVVKAAVIEAEKETGGRFELRTLMSQPPTEVGEDSAIIRALSEATKEVTGKAPHVGGMAGATVVKDLLAAGITAVGCGAGDPSAAHVANECVSISELVAFSQILALACMKFLQMA